ncbi:hypothetical protein CR513_56463, partial [Mucuna pruriens]
MRQCDGTNDNEIELSKTLTLHQTHTALAGAQLYKCTQMDSSTNTFMTRSQHPPKVRNIFAPQSAIKFNDRKWFQTDTSQLYHDTRNRNTSQPRLYSRRHQPLPCCKLSQQQNVRPAKNERRSSAFEIRWFKVHQKAQQEEEANFVIFRKIINKPEMVVSESMFDTPFELPNIAAAIIASVDSKPMALAIRPLTTIHITTVKPIYSHSMPQTLPILPSIPAPSSPSLNTIPIILPINPIPLIPPIHHVIVIHPSPPTLPLLKFTLVHVPIAINLHPTPPTRVLHLLLLRPNRPYDRLRRRG